jgi:acyl-CoA dehydrogenase
VIEKARRGADSGAAGAGPDAKETPLVDFSIEPEFQEKLDWIRTFTAEKLMPLHFLFDYSMDASTDIQNKPLRKIIRHLQDEVRAQGLWAPHLPPHLGGQGMGAVKLTYINEIIAQSLFGSVVFGCQGPDTGNMEILAMFGTPEQKKQYLEPLLANEIFSTFAMTEPHGGADATNIKCRAVRDGDDWVINGDKWFASNANHAAFMIVMTATDPDAPPYARATMFIVPTDTPGFERVRDIGFFMDPVGQGGHPWVRFTNVRVPDSARLGPVGEGFKVAQSRLGGGRLHHAQRTLARLRYMLDMMGERALSRSSQGSLIAEKQAVQFDIAQSFIDLQQFRLLILYTAWMFDQQQEHGREGRLMISAVKATMAKVTQDIHLRALHMHASIGLSNVMHFGQLLAMALQEGVADGPTEVHMVTVAKQILRRYKGVDGPFPSNVLWEKKPWAAAKLKPLADQLGVTLEEAGATF